MIEQWHQMVKSGDVAQLNNLLADDAVLFSPVVHTPIRGKKIVQHYLTAAYHTFQQDSFAYQPDIITGNKAVLEFDVTIDDIKVNGIDIITWNEQGLITEFKVMIRPLQAFNLINERMTAMLTELKSKVTI